MSTCPFCKRDPYHYVDIGVGYQAAAVDCCDLGIALHYGDKEAWQTLRNMRSHSPRKKARAMKVLREYGYRPDSKGRFAAKVFEVRVK
ncbi:hypothetical protein SAMN05216229_12367 [Geopseudomonas sagittaria]|uniref:Uncharacterized protein n=1 Tax=Geopseudomonas sagittaria TaxID=1135990 RepID=A0A1I5YRQ9_9GAMM|nr:hypothetical protein [Pseudomonas sagittaria]SFQ46916.1 hypothetical protein SAMN05216229_12367 [Pseudomonas sagittaria]